MACTASLDVYKLTIHSLTQTCTIVLPPVKAFHCAINTTTYGAIIRVENFHLLFFAWGWGYGGEGGRTALGEGGGGKGATSGDGGDGGGVPGYEWINECCEFVSGCVF